MIIKVKVSDNTYNFFEGDSVTQSKLNKFTLKELQNISNRATMFITTVNNSSEKTSFLSLTMYKNHTPVQWIITNHRCYLMNNEGKTIEKIN